MFNANRDGAGIAWREHGKVQWRKGLKEEEMRDLCLTVPIPYVAHFRIASCGGIKEELTHPFPIGKESSLALKGSTLNPVMFHNGHYHTWKEKLLTMATHGIKIPTGPWSDSRLMAFLAAHSSVNVLPFFEEKIVAFGLNDMDIWGTGWTLVDDIYVSNRTWESISQWQHRGVVTICRFGTCKKDRVDNTVWCEDHQGGIQTFHRDKSPSEVALAPTTFRGGNSDALSGDAEQEAVEEVAKPLRGAGTTRKEGQEGSSHSALSKGREMIGWVRQLNPKKVRTPVLASDIVNDDAQYYM